MEDLAVFRTVGTDGPVMLTAETLWAAGRGQEDDAVAVGIRTAR